MRKILIWATGVGCGAAAVVGIMHLHWGALGGASNSAYAHHLWHGMRKGGHLVVAGVAGIVNGIVPFVLRDTMMRHAASVAQDLVQERVQKGDFASLTFLKSSAFAHSSWGSLPRWGQDYLNLTLSTPVRTQM